MFALTCRGMLGYNCCSQAAACLIRTSFKFGLGERMPKGPWRIFWGGLDGHGVEYTFMDNACDQGSLELNHTS